MSRKYQKLAVWQEAIRLAEAVYRATRWFPVEERFGLSQQMRRAAVSVPSNIAEGAGRGTDKDFVRFLLIARGSLQEMETQLHLARRLGYRGTEQIPSDNIERVYAMLNKLIQALRSV